MRQAAHEGTDGSGKGTLYVVATPIGNLADVSARALDTLKSVDVIAAEDTRMTARLLDHYGIHGRMMALHEHNERRRARDVVDLLASGACVALVSDAGTPAISDPGARLVAEVRDAGYRVSPVPGPNAAITALSASGLEASQFLFCGFLPARHAERVKALQAVVRFPYSMVFYEAPHRIAESVRDLCEVFGGDRRIVLARELTKRFETIHGCTLREAEAWLQAEVHRMRGEFVLIVSGAAPAPDPGAGDARRILEVLLEELPLKQAVGLAARLTGGRRNALYEMALAMKGQRA